MKTRIISAALATFFILPIFGLTAYAAELDEPEDIEPIIAAIETVTEDAPEQEAAEAPAPEETTVAPVTDYPETPPRPFTPSGTGTVIDHATDADGKMFYTIMTPDEHVFYLVVDRQRGQENVYFLNAVTIDDLYALAENPKPAQGGTFTTQPPAVSNPEPPVETPPPAEQPQDGGNNGMFIIVVILVIAGGGAGWYFKIYRPKQQGAASGEEYDPSLNEAENYCDDDWGDDSDDDSGDTDDSPPWDDEDERGESDDK